MNPVGLSDSSLDTYRAIILVLSLEISFVTFSIYRISVVKCSTRDWGIAGLCLTWITVVSLSMLLNPLLIMGSTQEAFYHDWKIVDWDVKHNIKLKAYIHIFYLLTYIISGVEIQCIGHFKLLFCLLRLDDCAKLQQFALDVSNIEADTSWHVCSSKTQISLCICARWSESSMGAPLVAKRPTFLQAKSQDWSDCVDMQTDLNLYCMHMPTCILCWVPADLCIKQAMLLENLPPVYDQALRI